MKYTTDQLSSGLTRDMILKIRENYDPEHDLSFVSKTDQNLADICMRLLTEINFLKERVLRLEKENGHNE